jgi:hypothetical protein
MEHRSERTVKQSPAIHESFARDEGIQSSSDRVFGLVMAGVLFFLAFQPFLRGRGVRWWSLTAAVAFLLSALLFPRVLRRLNWLWLKVGLVLHAIVNPVVMGLLFYLTVTPIGLLFRWLGKDPLRLHFDKTADTYWIERRPPGPTPDTMPRQF